MTEPDYSFDTECEAAYHRGVADYAAGKRLESGNPYPKPTVEHGGALIWNAWRAGWAEADGGELFDSFDGSLPGADPAPRHVTA